MAPARLRSAWLLLALLSACSCAPRCSCRPGGPAPSRRVADGVHAGRFRAVAVNARHTCALDERGLAVCFGGDDTRRPPMTPAPTEPLAGLETGRRFACGITEAAGQLRCWGNCSGGRCDAPAGRFVDLSLDDDSGGCAWDEGGRAECWGTAPSVTGVPVALLASGVADIVLGMGWGIVLREDGTLGAWGEQAIARDPSLRRVIAERRRFAAIAGRGAAACLIDAAGRSTCVSYYDNQTPPEIGGRVVAIDFASPMGAVPACVMVEHADDQREVACTTTLKGYRLPRQRGAIVDFGVGDDHLCTVDRDGRLRCVGHDLFGSVSGRLLGHSARWP